MTFVRDLQRPIARTLARRLVETGAGDFFASLFADGTDGFYFDFSKTNRLFQNASATTLADDAGENIALALESHAWAGRTYAQQVAAQSELVSNPGGPFTSTTDWTALNSTLSVSGGELEITATGASGHEAVINLPVTSGKTYRCTFTLRAKAGNSQGARFRVKDQIGPAYKESYTVASGQSLTQTFVFVAASGSYQVTAAPASLGAWGSIGDTAYLSSVSVKEVPGNHGLQATTAAQPKYQTGGLARFDGLDDYLDTPFIFSAGPATIAVDMSPGAGSASDVPIGVTIANRFCISVGATGLLTAAYGNSGSLIIGASDVRGAGRRAAFLVYDGTNVNLYDRGALVGSAAPSGSHTTDRAIPVGAYRAGNDGTLGGFFAGDIYHALAIKKALTAAQIATATGLWGA